MNDTRPAAAIAPAPRAYASQAARRDGAEALLFDLPDGVQSAQDCATPALREHGPEDAQAEER